MGIFSLDILVSLTGLRNEIENNLSSGDVFMIRGDGQWKASSFLGLQK